MSAVQAGLNDPAVLADLIEERAALIEDGEKCSRALAEDRAARAYGFASWADWIKRGRAAVEVTT